MTRPLYVATSNQGKLRDFAVAAESFFGGPDHGFALRTLPGLEAIPAPAEDADTLEGNARAKACSYSLHAPGSVVIADDSGLEVDALDGAPGVYSARYAESAGALTGEANAANNRHLLAELARVLTPSGLLASLDHRSARYRCVLAAAQDGACLCTGEGSVEGRILLAARGEGGFGYDPLFYLPALEQTMAELDPVTRLGLSHRGEALRAMLTRLGAVLPAGQTPRFAISSKPDA